MGGKQSFLNLIFAPRKVLIFYAATRSALAWEERSSQPTIGSKLSMLLMGRFGFRYKASGLPSLSTDSVSPKLSFRFNGLKINLTG